MHVLDAALRFFAATMKVAGAGLKVGGAYLDAGGLIEEFGVVSLRLDLGVSETTREVEDHARSIFALLAHSSAHTQTMIYRPFSK
ncbi:MAG TPA: hypothetical protein VK014_13615 [Cyclobacteriaceae bacterium]|nr:hypothetical protein [Cyclobacteriaceae bacterium]